MEKVMYWMHPTVIFVSANEIRFHGMYISHAKTHCLCFNFDTFLGETAGRRWTP